MRTFYDLIREQVDKRDYIAALVAHNIVLEGMAYPVYRYEIRYWSTLDPALSQIIQGAFADEVQHVSFGMTYLRDNIRYSPELRNRVTQLARDCNRLMTAVFESAIDRYIALYQEAANAHLDLMGDIEIFPGRRMAQITEEEQVRTLLAEIQQEHRKRLGQIGIEA
jgi:predicted transcriptional regulator